MKENLKKLVAVVLAGTMVLGSAMTVLAEDVSSDGAGTYEGDKLVYPTLSITLPTITEGTYNYTADPNGNLAAVATSRLGADAQLKSTTGVYFLTDTNLYTDTSKDYVVENQNAQDIIVTGSVKVKTAGASGIKYSETSDFSADEVKDQTAIYLAIQNKAKTKVAPLKGATANDAGEISMVIRGNKDNYEPKYTQSPESGHQKYEYAVKSGDLSWNKATFQLTGALNKKVAWSGTTTDTLSFPAVTVTYKYAAVPVMTGAEATGYSYTWASNKPAGTIQALAIDGTDRPGVVTNQKITYNATSGQLTLDPAPVANFGLATGNHTLLVKIGADAATAVEYTLNIEN